MNEREFSLKLWIGIAVGAIATGVAMAFLAGFFLGHFTGHTDTTTVGATSASEGEGESSEVSETTGSIQSAPAFTAEELEAPPTENWLTNGGSLLNQRYSPLDEISTDNVADLKGAWHIHLNGSGLATKYSAEGTPVVYAGTMYIPTGADDVFAIDVKTGERLWTYEAKLPEQISTICCGWDNRGVAIGDGLVYVSRLDGRVVALDQQTGEVKWTSEVGKWQNGETITMAPLYYNGRVYVGVSGGEFGIRGRLTAFDAKTGKLDWRFYTTPGPGETGHDTWPANNQSWNHGGAPVWNTPAVDPKLNMLYFSTGNASPDLNGSGRPGENLFTTAIVAIDAETGKYKWHFQEVHHDIWDYDAPSPVVLWDAEVEGEMVHGLSQPGKTGWLYMLNRETGKPVHGIEERPVPQNKSEQATAPTQPFPSTPPFVPHSITSAQFAEIKKLARETFKGKIKVRKGGIFDVFGKEMTVMATGPSGGTNWPPSSFNPNTEDVYICGIGGYAGYQTHQLEKLHPGKTYLSSVFSLQGFGSYDGYLVAQNVSTGEIDWQRKFPKEACYSGTTTTAGNLVFSGRNNGDLVAYDAESGDELWSFQTGAGANTTPAIFESEGKEYVAFYAGGNSLAASAHGDDLWLFSLDGEIGPAEAGGPAEQGQHAGEEAPEANVEEAEGSPNEAAGGGNESVEEEASTGDPAAGKVVFAENCSVCHGVDGLGGNGGPDLTTQPLAKTANGTIRQVTNGGGGMPAFAEVLSTKEIEDVAAYVAEVINGKGK